MKSEELKVHNLYDKVYDWLIIHGPRILLAIVIFIVGQWLVKICRRWVSNAFHKHDINDSVKPFMESLIATALQVLLALAVLQVVGVKMTIFAAGIASFGVAVGLALSGTLQNFAGGVLILLLKPFKVGDNIVAQGQDGVVTSIQIFYTLITTYDNKTVIIPNSKLSNEIIINISREGRRRLDIEMKFSYAWSPEQIQDIVRKSISESKDVIQEHQPNVGISSLDPDGFKIIIQVWVGAFDYNNVKIIFQQKLLKDLKNAGIKFPGM
jgi:small conductance mechanosensitive channel